MPVTPLREERSTMEELAPSVILLGMRALNDKVLKWLVTLAAGVCWGFTVLHPEPLRIVAATLASLTVLFPFLFRRGE